jgi:hypothetical protein
MNATPAIIDGVETPEPQPEPEPEAAPARSRSRGSRKSASGPKAGTQAKSEGKRKSADGAAAKPRKGPAKPRATRTRTRKETPAL